MEKLQNLEGEAFDREYLSEMIKHHESGIEMMKMAIEKAESEALRDMSEKMAKTQAEEIEKMKGMLAEL